MHLRERLQRALKQKTDKVEITKVQPMHLRDRLQRALRKKTPKISVDKEVLKDFYLTLTLKLR